MPWFPGAVRKEVPRFRRALRPVRVNFHTAVSSTTSLYSYFSRPGVVCSHFYVREDGTVEQYVDTKYRAAADLYGNPDTISVETWDGYMRHWRDGDPVPAWTPAQVEALVRLLAWIFETHPTIPRQIARDSRPGASSHGLSWHRLGCDPYRADGGIRYSTAYGKSCPGDARIGQIPTIFARATGDPNLLEDDDVALEPHEKRALAWLDENRADFDRLQFQVGDVWTYREKWNEILARATGAEAGLKALAEAKGVEGDAALGVLREEVAKAVAGLEITLRAEPVPTSGE